MSVEKLVANVIYDPDKKGMTSSFIEADTGVSLEPHGELGTNVSRQGLVVLEGVVREPTPEEAVSFLEGVKKPFEWLARMVHFQLHGFQPEPLPGYPVLSEEDMANAREDEGGFYLGEVRRLSYLTVLTMDRVQPKVSGPLIEGPGLERFVRFAQFKAVAHATRMVDFARTYERQQSQN